MAIEAPPPPGPAVRVVPGRIPGRWRAVLAATTLVPLVVWGGLFIRTDSFSIEPGPATDVSNLIRVSGPRTESKGAFLITTVSLSVDTISLFESLRAWVDPVIQTIPREALIPKGTTSREQDELNQIDMEESKYFASVVAVGASGLDVRAVDGARVIKAFDGSPAAQAGIKGGDVIVSVDGAPVKNVREMSTAIRAKAVGDTVRIGILRGEESKTIPVKTAPDRSDPKRPIIGVYTGPAFRLPVDVVIDSQDIVGPSGGLVFALAIVDALDDRDLTGGHRVAATGTIDLSGEIGVIGGVAQKVRAAERSGADVFLVPAPEVAEAKAAARTIEVYGVTNIGQAVDLLASLPPLGR